MSGRDVRLYPLRLTVTAKPLVFGGHALARRLGKTGIPDWSVAETWECSDVAGLSGVVTEGPLAGRSLRQVVADHPQDLMGAGWSGRCFPVLTKFIDATGSLPVHLHADDEAARRLEGQRNGKTEAWHILDAAPGATTLCGVREGVTPGRLRAALQAQDFDAVLRRLPVRAGETIYVPGGTPHSFGPDTLVYEIEQTSDIQQHAMRWRMEDGSPVSDAEFDANLDMLMRQVHPEMPAGLHPRAAHRPRRRGRAGLPVRESLLRPGALDLRRAVATLLRHRADPVQRRRPGAGAVRRLGGGTRPGADASAARVLRGGRDHGAGRRPVRLSAGPGPRRARSAAGGRLPTAAHRRLGRGELTPVPAARRLRPPLPESPHG
ncbi:class I mannose-6-phosphate isomerase [Streptomyces sennicomposti]|uniref:class I mannose-6-phosphate isomerase n=1 Tax=Streptomyces sennicomposti TaxID=2873384 RepID=UPI0027E0FB6D|nr:class I mannose-6-phosphate isomerase [Streptomyces sennicomposti]